MEGVLAVVTCFAADFAPKYWALCNGQTLPISQNTALFSLLGTTYGGNGQTTFNLPDLRGRRPVSAGQSPGTSNYNLGQPAGSETVTLNFNCLPAHSHTGIISLHLNGDSSAGSVKRALNTFPAGTTNAYAAAPTGQMATPGYNVTIGIAGSSLPVPVQMPYLVVNYIICMYGIFPSRD